LALGRTHELINLLALPGFLYFLPKEFYLPFGLGYVLGTFLLSPDLDLKHSKPFKRWKALKILLFPYQKNPNTEAFPISPFWAPLRILLIKKYNNVNIY
jgi:uncharacterized metal-binding protein